jgi:hypothetical protein
MISINFTEEEAKYLSDYLEKTKNSNVLHYDVYAKVHDNYHHFKFLKWKKQKEQEGKK